MMRIILLIILVFPFIELSANPDSFLNKIVQATTVTEIDSIIARSHIRGYHLRINRSIEGDYFQRIHQFDYIYGDRYQTFQINLVNIEEKLVFGEVLQLHWRRNRIEYEEVFVKADDQLYLLLNRFNESYLADYNLDDFLYDLNDIIEYSFGCGNGAAFKPKESQRMESWVLNKRKNRILSWLCKPNPEYQAYAVWGMRKIAEQGVELTSDEESILNYVIEKNLPIQNCSGCMGGLQTPLVELVGINK